MLSSPPGAAGSTPPHSQGIGYNWAGAIGDPLSLTRLNGQTTSASSNAATPRRYTPPSPNSHDLNEFFGPAGIEWHGVRVQRLATTTTKQDVKTMFLFSSGFEDVRIIKTAQAMKDPTGAEAYVKFKSRESAEEAERFIHDREINGVKLIVKVVPRPQPQEIIQMAANMELLSPEYKSQSPSGSDGLPAPAAKNGVIGEYTTASARNLVSASTNGHMLTNGMNGLGRLDSGITNDVFGNGLNGSARINGNGLAAASEPEEVLPVLSSLALKDSINAIPVSKPFESAFLGGSSALLADRGLGSLDDGAVGDSYASPIDPLAASYRTRRPTNPTQQSRFGALPPLATANINGFGASAMTAPPVAAPPQLASPLSMNSPAAAAAAAAAWPSNPQNKSFYPTFPITSHPPANPADQNPPCNTLYVGNLPAQTSEDELKALFCRQRGYKRMCFRTKPQGPMCFVEFEDTHYATKALTELYGRALSNSTKGGVRLSFSKNPLGVRSQNNPNNQNPKTPTSAIPGPTAQFPTPLRNPPGLPTPTTRTEPPGLFPSSTLQRPAVTTSQPGRLPPGIYTSADLRTPVDLRNPAADLGTVRPPSNNGTPVPSGPGPIGSTR